MTHNFLFEIGLEEMPARVILDAEHQLKNLLTNFLNDKNLAYGEIKTYSTPRRLAAVVKGLAEGQEDTVELAKGPSKKIALDEDGNWSKAAIGFSKGQGKDVDDITFKEVNGEEYVFIEKEIKGLSTEEVLKDVPDLAKKITFPVTMKWARNNYRYIRPVHTLITLLDDKAIASELFDVKSSNFSRGHRFLGETVEINSVDDYEGKLKDVYVIADRDKRKEMIRQQITDLCESNGWQVPLYNQALLDEVTDLVEYPTAFYGTFDKAFLDVPEKILETSMADHQRYFPVRSENGEFLPYFIGVRNGDDKQLKNVIKGNEKVLSARLEDAKFFYEEDKKSSIQDYLEKLSKVTYHEKLGSMVDKQKRTRLIASDIGEYIGLESQVADQVDEASQIYKFDLVTQVVDEFSTLQGYIGSVYAKEQGIDDQVAEAIGEQYLPITSGGILPETKAGSILALSDKVEALLMFFSIGLIPTGSNDPFALRRTAYGLVRILEDQAIELDLTNLFEKLSDQLSLTNKDFIADLEIFVRDRLNQYLKDHHGIDYDLRQAAISAGSLNPSAIVEKAKVLQTAKGQQDFKLVGESLSRIANMAKKHPSNQEVNLDLSETDSEKDLIQAAQDLSENFDDHSYHDQFELLRQVSPKVEAFFENNMVNAENSEIKENRFALLNLLYNQAHKFADFNQVLTK